MNRFLLLILSVLMISMLQAGDAEPEKFAEEELRHWLGELSEAPVEEQFRLGTEYLGLFPEDKVALGDSDGFAVRRKDGYIYIASPKPRGVLYGVYAFLERNSDIVWARADKDFEAVMTRLPKLEIKDADFRERPSFDLRGWWICGPQVHEPTELWYTRMRCNFTSANLKKEGVEARAVKFGTVINRGGGHNMPRFYTDEMFAEHPEYFGEEKGSRVREVTSVHPCFSNLDGARAAATNVIARMRELPEQPPEAFAIKHADHQTVCKCEKCRVNPDSVSTRFFKYLNVMMEEIRKVYPNTRIDTFGYQITAPAPEVKVDENVNVCFCPYVKNDKYSILDPTNAVWKSRADEWASKGTKNLIWREYFGDGMAFPRPIAPMVARDLKYISSQLGIRRVYAETIPDLTPSNKKRMYSQAWDVSAMEYWVLSRLMWNPNQSIAALRADYLRRTYRKAAPAVGRFYKLIIDEFYKSSAASRFDANQYQESMRYLFKTGIEADCRAALDEAASLASTERIPAVSGLVARIRARFDDWCAHKNDFERQELIVPNTADWNKANSSEQFYLRGAIGRNPPESSRLSVRHDTEKLFVRFRCDDGRASHLTAPEYNPNEEIPLDGDGVKIGVALGKEAESPSVTLSCDVNGNRCDTKSVKPWRAFNAEWKAVCNRDKKGYTIDFEIPFKSLGLDSERNKNLEVYFYRLIRHDDRRATRQKVVTFGGSDPRKRATWTVLKFE